MNISLRQQSVSAFVCGPLWALLTVLALNPDAGGAEPTVKWTYQVKSNLYAPPLVADVHPSPGQEIIISDSEARQLCCISATGTQLWEFHGGWKKRLTSAASLSWTVRPGKGTLLLGNADGTLCCVDAETGTEVWRSKVGGIEWGTAIWTDLNGDGRDEAVAGTERDGIIALNADSTPLWTCKALKDGRAPHIVCPIGAADVDGDGKCEVFAVDDWGPFCLNADGSIRWESLTGDQFISSPVIAYMDNAESPSVVCWSKDSNAVHAFDATTGKLKWSSLMLGAPDVYPGSSIAVGDIVGDDLNHKEIVTADAEGHVCCLAADGRPLWTFSMEKRTHGAVSLGDVDGDDDIETLVAGGDHFLYCLTSRGELKWRFEAKLRLIHPATIADVDGDGKTEILVCGSDGALRCLTLGGRYVPERIPWPARRFDVGQTGFTPGKPTKGPSKTVREERSLLVNTTFAASNAQEKLPADVQALRGGRPMDWFCETPLAGTWVLDAEHPSDKGPILKVVADKQGDMVIASAPVPVENSLHAIRPSAVAQGEHAFAEIEWRGDHGVIGRCPVQVLDGPPTAMLQPPSGAKWVVLRLITAQGKTAWWNRAELTGIYEHSRELRVFVNQLGYDLNTPKRFTVQSNYKGEKVTFEIVDETGKVVHQGELRAAGRIMGAYGPDWGFNYWRGDFTDFNVRGSYRVRVAMEGISDTSTPFKIDEHLHWNGTARPAYRFFYYQRCGMEIPGFHNACHLDDAVSPDGKRQYDLAGGWHDAGDYNKYHNAPYVFGLTRVYGVGKARFDTQDEDSNNISDFFDECLWGAEHSRKMIAPDGSAYGAITSGYGFWGPPELETDNKPGTGDERPIRGAETGNDPTMHAAAMARIARFASDKTPWIEAAARAQRWALQKGVRGLIQLSATLDLYEVTKDRQYAETVKELFAEKWPANLGTVAPSSPDFGYAVDAIEQYDRLFGQDHREEVRKILVEKAEAMLTLADNPFGVYTFGPKEKPNFFGTPPNPADWHVGTSSHVLNAAGAMACAYRYAGDPRYLAFVYDQFNWILGNNPYGISLMEGVGSVNLPSYHHRYTFAGVPRGAVPGSVVNGFTWRAGGDDRPYLDVRGLDIPDYSPNEVWLPHNTAYLNALVNLERAREE